MAIKFNDSDAVYGGFQDCTPKPVQKVDSDLAAGLGIIGLGLAAGLAAAMDEIDADDRALREARRHADEAARRRDAEKRRLEEAERILEKARAEAAVKREAAALRARLAAIDELGYGLSESQLSRALIKFSMQEKNKDAQPMTPTTLSVMFLLREQGATFTNVVEDNYDHTVVFTGTDRDLGTVRVSLSWTGTLEIRAYEAMITRYGKSSRIAYKRYESLVPVNRREQFEAVVRRASN